MSNHGCVNGNLDDENYSSPVPVIGLYVAGASALCMLMMIYDIVKGCRDRKRWLPCKSFTLNSVTLTLLSIAVKLPIDLTTPMPNTKDQLSKLSGTAFVCISMGFLIPSLGIFTSSECFSNLLALTIFVITICVNIYMQLNTGLIVLFIAEHIIISCSMLLLIMLMWSLYFHTNSKRRVRFDLIKSHFTEGSGSMFDRIMKSYMISYGYNPQLVVCTDKICVVVGIISLLCLVTLLQAAFRTIILKQLEFCSGTSDYKWSVPIILGTQIITVVIGSVAVIFRWLSLSCHLDIPFKADFVNREANGVIRRNETLGIVSKLHKLLQSSQDLYVNSVVVVQLAIMFIPTIVVDQFWLLLRRDSEMDSADWKVQKAYDDFQRSMYMFKSKSENLDKLLLHKRPSPKLLSHSMQLQDQEFPDQDGVIVSSLSIVLLVRIAEFCLPSGDHDLLKKSFEEVEEIIHLIDRTIRPNSSIDDENLLLAKAVWAGKPFSCLDEKMMATPGFELPQSEINQAITRIKALKNVLNLDVVWKELGLIIDFINRQEYSSVEGLRSSIVQMFVDMLHLMLGQLPNAIFKILGDSTAEQYEEDIRLSLKLICNVGNLDTLVKWSFPNRSGFSKLIIGDASTQMEDSISICLVSTNVCNAVDDVNI